MRLRPETKKRVKKVLLWVIVSLAALFAVVYAVYLVEIAGVFAGGQRYPMGLDQSSLPKFVTFNQIEVDELDEVTKFRSGSGHSYTDPYEGCRSMKHYFVTSNKEGGINEVPIYSPVDGKITVSLWDNQDGTQVWIKPDGYPQFTVILFHVSKLDGVPWFSRVEAGQQIGWQKTNGNDVAIMQAGPFGWRFRSVFQVMDDKTFAEYAEYGITDREQMIISKKERDANPFECKGQMFTHSTRLPEDYVPINAEPEMDAAGQSQQRYASQQACEQASGRTCQHISCDATQANGPDCPQGAQPGWYPTIDTDPANSPSNR